MSHSLRHQEKRLARAKQKARQNRRMREHGGGKPWNLDILSSFLLKKHSKETKE